MTLSLKSLIGPSNRHRGPVDSSPTAPSGVARYQSAALSALVNRDGQDLLIGLRHQV